VHCLAAYKVEEEEKKERRRRRRGREMKPNEGGGKINDQKATKRDGN